MFAHHHHNNNFHHINNDDDNNNNSGNNYNLHVTKVTNQVEWFTVVTLNNSDFVH